MTSLIAPSLESAEKLASSMQESERDLKPRSARKIDQIRR